MHPRANEHSHSVKSSSQRLCTENNIILVCVTDLLMQRDRNEVRWFTDWQSFRLCFSVILAACLVPFISFVESRNPWLETSGRIALRTCFIAASLPGILSVVGLGLFASTSFVVLNMISFSTSFSSLFFSGKPSKIGHFCSSCSVFSLLSAIAVLIDTMSQRRI